MINSVNDQVLQAKQIVIDRSIIIDNHPVNIRAETLCIHGDHPGALTSSRLLRSALEAEGIEIKYYA
jgi:lactam utilization protein B